MNARLTASRKRTPLALCATATALALAGCGGTPLEQATSETVSMGDATPAESPAESDPDGEVVDFEPVRDLDSTNGIIGVRTEHALITGTAADITAGKGSIHELDSSCGDVSANDGSFVVACDGEIKVFGAKETTIQTDHPVTTATITTSGEVLAASGAERTVWLFNEGEEVQSFPVARETDQIQAVPVEGQEDTVVRVCSFDTTIQQLDWRGKREGGTLRVGLGVGKVAAGENGLILAADSNGSQLLVYTSDDIIRLHQMAPVPGGPWDASWDPTQRLAWVSSTAENLATGYDISQGVPLQRAQVRTVPDARSIVSLDDGTLILASATGAGLQIVPPTAAGER